MKKIIRLSEGGLVRLVKRVINESKNEPSTQKINLTLTGADMEIYTPTENAIKFMKSFNLMDDYCDDETERKVDIILNTISYLEDQIRHKYMIPWTKDTKDKKGMWNYNFDSDAVGSDPMMKSILMLKYKFLSYSNIKERCCKDGEFVCDEDFNRLPPPETEEMRLQRLINKQNEKDVSQFYYIMYHNDLRNADDELELKQLYIDVDNNYKLDDDKKKTLLISIINKINDL
jgi:hypothetical protein